MISLQCICFGLFVFNSNWNSLILTVLLSHKLSTSDAFITSSDNILFFLFMEVRVLCYHPSCHRCFNWRSSLNL